VAGPPGRYVRDVKEALPRQPTRVKVGERVGVSVGGRLLEATVIEDRGDLGARGQQVVRLSVAPETALARTAAPPRAAESGHEPAAEPYEVELPVDWLQPAPRRKR
jgi:hypothetical protein